MLRRRLVIEWDDEGTDTDEECAKAFLRGEWTIEDLTALDQSSHPDERVRCTVRVEDA